MRVDAVHGEHESSDDAARASGHARTVVDEVVGEGALKAKGGRRGRGVRRQVHGTGEADEDGQECGRDGSRATERGIADSRCIACRGTYRGAELTSY